MDLLVLAGVYPLDNSVSSLSLLNWKRSLGRRGWGELVLGRGLDDVRWSFCSEQWVHSHMHMHMPGQYGSLATQTVLVSESMFTEDFSFLFVSKPLP